MRENRQHGSEGGEAGSLPYPYRGRNADASLFRPVGIISWSTVSTRTITHQRGALGLTQYGTHAPFVGGEQSSAP